MRAAAQAAVVAGIPALEFLECEDPVRLLVLDAVRVKAIEVREELADQQAVLIAKRVGEALGLFKP